MDKNELTMNHIQKEEAEMSLLNRFFHNFQWNDDEIQYTTVPTLDLSEEEIKECSELFGEFYGRYNADSPIRPQEAIRMPFA